MAVDTPSVQYKEMAKLGSWDLIKDLLGDTPAMRAAKTKRLPKEPQEKIPNYNNRVNRSFLTPLYKDTIDKIVARPFSRPATWDVKNNDEALAAAKRFMVNMDGEEMTHQEFALEWLTGIIEWGVAHVFSDYPEIDNPDTVTKEDEQEEDILPLNRIIPAPELIGWKTEEQTNGAQRVTEIRVKETYIEDGADWTQTVYDQIRVITREGWQVYKREVGKRGRGKKEYVPGDKGEISVNGETPKRIPLVTVYAKKKTLMVAYPPLKNLAWTNLEHWQSASDQKNILRFDRFGILWAAGVSEDEKNKGIIVAPTQAAMSENADATLMRVETNGKPAENGWKDLNDIMERAEVQGAQPMIQRYGKVKATGIKVSESKSRSMVEMWIDGLEIGMRKLIRWNLAWMGFDIPLEDIEYNIYKDFVFGTGTGKDVTELREARKMKDLSHETYIKELQRHGILSDAIDAAVEKAKVTVEQGTGVGLFNENGTPPVAGNVGATV